MLAGAAVHAWPALQKRAQPLPPLRPPPGRLALARLHPRPAGGVRSTLGPMAASRCAPQIW